MLMGLVTEAVVSWLAWVAGWPTLWTHPAAGPRPPLSHQAAAGHPAPQFLLSFFLAPLLSSLQAPGYFSVIKQPMDFSTMRGKAQRGEYAGWQELRADMRCVHACVRWGVGACFLAVLLVFWLFGRGAPLAARWAGLLAARPLARCALCPALVVLRLPPTHQ